jgi:hypothetical protein
MWTELEAAKQAMQSTFHMQAELDRAREEAELNCARLVTYQQEIARMKVSEIPTPKSENQADGTWQADNKRALANNEVSLARKLKDKVRK